MRRLGQGLIDKLYWREVQGRWHCFKRCSSPKYGAYGLVTGSTYFYVALCYPGITIGYVRSQRISRPKAVLRCAQCDGAEMKRRGWEESGPERL